MDLWGLVAGAATMFTINYFTRKAAYGVKAGELRFGPFIWGLGLVCLLCSIVPFGVLITDSYEIEKPGEKGALIGLTIGFGLVAIYSIGEGFFVKGKFDEKSIHFKSPWTGVKNEHWENLKSASFNRWCYWYVLEFASGAVIRISSYLGGHGHLLDFLRKNGHDL